MGRRDEGKGWGEGVKERDEQGRDPSPLALIPSPRLVLSCHLLTPSPHPFHSTVYPSYNPLVQSPRPFLPLIPPLIYSPHPFPSSIFLVSSSHSVPSSRPSPLPLI